VRAYKTLAELIANGLATGTGSEIGAALSAHGLRHSPEAIDEVLTACAKISRAEILSPSVLN
jgi:hypothetical protein